MKTQNSKTAVGYVRVSSTIFNDRNLTYQGQKELIEKYCETKGLKLLDIFVDYSHGMSVYREGLQDLFFKVRGEGITYVLVTDPDRLSRNFSEYSLIQHLLKRVGTEIKVVNNQALQGEILTEGMLNTLNTFYSRIGKKR